MLSFPSLEEVKVNRTHFASFLALILVCFFIPVQFLHAQENREPLDPGYVEVFEVSGLLDQVLASALEDSITDAQTSGANALILQLNSKQAVISNERLIAIGQAFMNSSIPIEVWVGPSGSTAQGKVAQLALVADSLGVSIGSSIGKTGEIVFSGEEFGSVLIEKTNLFTT